MPHGWYSPPSTEGGRLSILRLCSEGGYAPQDLPVRSLLCGPRFQSPFLFLFLEPRHHPGLPGLLLVVSVLTHHGRTSFGFLLRRRTCLGATSPCSFPRIVVALGPRRHRIDSPRRAPPTPDCPQGTGWMGEMLPNCLGSAFGIHAHVGESGRLACVLGGFFPICRGRLCPIFWHAFSGTDTNFQGNWPMTSFSGQNRVKGAAKTYCANTVALRIHSWAKAPLVSGVQVAKSSSLAEDKGPMTNPPGPVASNAGENLL